MERCVFDSERPDFVRVKILNLERAGAQHNYTRNVTPPCALILRACYETQATSESRKKAMKNEFVLGGKNRVTPSDLSKYATKMLLRAGITNDTLAAAKKEVPTESAARTLLKNTYRKNLAQRCGLSARGESGTFKFLCGLSLAGDVTSSNYTSFTDDEAAERHYALMRPLCLEKPIDKVSPTKNEDGTVTYHITPNTTAELAGVITKCTLLPGQKIIIRCPHGVTGTVRATAIKLINEGE